MTYKWDHFEISYYYTSTLLRVFRSWSTCKGLKSFFVEDITVSSTDNKMRADSDQIQSGDKYSWTWRHGYTISGEFRLVVPDERVEFTFGPMLVSVSFRQTSDAVLLRLCQFNIPVTDEAKPTSHMNCRICWTFFLTNLKSVLLNGTDLRDDNPARASSFEVGYKPVEVP
jgi:uncharacterized protein YndB with AHSA1/START domain